MRDEEFYLFIKDIITNKNYPMDLMRKKKLVKLVAQSYDGDVKKLLFQCKDNFYDKSLHDDFLKSISNIRRLLWNF